MMRGKRAFAVGLTAGLLASTLAVAAPTAQPLDATPSAARTTIDPQPPMALSVEVAALQKHVRGGIATMVLKVSAEVGVEGAVVTAKAPLDLRFADGSTEKTWNVDLAGGGARELRVDVLVPRDGRYAITAEVEGSVKGRAIRRGAAGNLLVGRVEASLRSRAGAVEYRALEAAGE
jgi:hypothetical protein